MIYNDLDFIEIGTSNFDTLIQKSTDLTRGISVEPIKHYLDQLPNKKNVKKINCAISDNKIEKYVNIFYIPESVILKKNLPNDLKGCNSINEYHPAHKKLNLTHLVKIEKVRQMTISELLIENNVGSIEFLQLDTEGNDTKILIDLRSYLSDKSDYFHPNYIKFESNSLNNKEEIRHVLKEYERLEYNILKSNKKNTLLKKVKDI